MDSNGDEAGSGAGTNIMSQPHRVEMPYQVHFDVDEATDHEKTNIQFFLDRSLQCKPNWSTGQSKLGGYKPERHSCSEGPKENELGCDNPYRVSWQEWNDGWERYFECWFTVLPPQN